MEINTTNINTFPSRSSTNSYSINSNYEFVDELSLTAQRQLIRKESRNKRRLCLHPIYQVIPFWLKIVILISSLIFLFSLGVVVTGTMSINDKKQTSSQQQQSSFVNSNSLKDGESSELVVVDSSTIIPSSPPSRESIKEIRAQIHELIYNNDDGDNDNPSTTSYSKVENDFILTTVVSTTVTPKLLDQNSNNNTISSFNSLLIEEEEEEVLQKQQEIPKNDNNDNEAAENNNARNNETINFDDIAFLYIHNKTDTLGSNNKVNHTISESISQQALEVSSTSPKEKVEIGGAMYLDTPTVTPTVSLISSAKLEPTYSGTNSTPSPTYTTAQPSSPYPTSTPSLLTTSLSPSLATTESSSFYKALTTTTRSATSPPTKTMPPYIIKRTPSNTNKLKTFLVTGGNLTISQLQHIQIKNTADSSFLVHLGNFISDNTTSCTETQYSTFSSSLQKNMNIPVFIIPGRNDWYTCNNTPQSMAYAYWIQYFDDFETNWPASLDLNVSKNHKGSQQSFTFVYNNVLFVGIKLLQEDESMEYYYSIKTFDYVKSLMNKEKGNYKSLIVFGDVAFTGIDTNGNNDGIAFFQHFIEECRASKDEITCLYMYGIQEKILVVEEVDESIVTIGVPGGSLPLMEIQIDEMGSVLVE